jgi:chaperonin cofactor prefoldin
MGSSCSKAGGEDTGNFLTGLDEDMSILSKLQGQLEKEIEDTENFKEENDKLMSDRVRELLKEIGEITPMEEKGVVVRQIDSEIERLPRVPTPFIVRQKQREHQLAELRIGLQRAELRFTNSNLRLKKNYLR